MYSYFKEISPKIFNFSEGVPEEICTKKSTPKIFEAQRRVSNKKAFSLLVVVFFNTKSIFRVLIANFVQVYKHKKARLFFAVQQVFCAPQNHIKIGSLTLYAKHSLWTNLFCAPFNGAAICRKRLATAIFRKRFLNLAPQKTNVWPLKFFLYWSTHLFFEVNLFSFTQSYIVTSQ